MLPSDCITSSVLSTLRSYQAAGMLGTENVIVEVRNPLLARNGGVEVRRGWF
jgi:hypothetical protein